jgi:hypothetical protein
MVAQVDGLADRLEADAVLGQPGNGQQAGDRARAGDKYVVSDLVSLALRGQDGSQFPGVFDAGNGRRDHPAATQDLAQGHHHVPRLERTGRGFG